MAKEKIPFIIQILFMALVLCIIAFLFVPPIWEYKTKDKPEVVIKAGPKEEYGISDNIHKDFDDKGGYTYCGFIHHWWKGQIIRSRFYCSLSYLEYEEALKREKEIGEKIKLTLSQDTLFIKDAKIFYNEIK